MPHWVKKVRNAFCNESRWLEFRGKDMELNMIHSMWLASGDSDVSRSAEVRKYKFTNEHFVLTSYSKMRVYLAMHVMSKTCIRLIQDYCAEESNLADLQDYQPMIDLFNAIDRLVDIMNGRKSRGVEYLNNPRHEHIFELFAILRLFEEWKEECGGFNERFITQYTYETNTDFDETYL